MSWKADIDAIGVLRDYRRMFARTPTARADLKPGTLYALVGEGGWLYYGQVTRDKSVGFFRRRDSEIAESQAILSSPVLSVVSVGFPSITRALRNGLWHKLGRFELVEALRVLPPIVQWPVGTLDVSVWSGADIIRETRVEDPEIQDFEVMAVWDAEENIPARLTADFGSESAVCHIGGPIWRERRIRENMARQYPDQQWHQLPPDWVSTDGK